MKNPMAVLTRLFRGSGAHNPVISALHMHAIGRPLMVHPDIGAQLIQAYMSGDVEGISEPLMAVDVPVNGAKPKRQQVAVLNITGPLVDRPQPGLCDDGPLSYEAIRDAFDRSMADESVSGIIFRMRTPGGMVDGCFDLTDHIHASRGTKPIVAVVDNMAYSAGYAIASACDDIYVSRTGGVGSVGVYSYHLDITEANAKAGYKVTMIYAGDRKVEMSPHVQLSDEAKAGEQAIVNEMYGMFTSAVARYRGMDVADVIATQAGTFNGQAAIDAGFATKLGTMREALAAFAETDEQRSAREAAAAESQRVADRAASLQAIAAADLKPDVLAALLDPAANITAASAITRIEHAKAVVDLCVAAGERSLARDYIVKNVELEAVRIQLLDLRATDGPEVVTTIPAAGAGKSSLDTQGIYASRRKPQ